MNKINKINIYIRNFQYTVIERFQALKKDGAFKDENENNRDYDILELMLEYNFMEHMEREFNSSLGLIEINSYKTKAIEYISNEKIKYKNKQ
jgi:hypothetical protein